MTDLMKLVLGWTIVGAFVIVTLFTVLSLVGWIRFADRRHQQKLFQALIVSVVVQAGGLASGSTKLDPRPVAEELRTDGKIEGRREGEAIGREDGLVVGRNRALLDVTTDLLASSKEGMVLDKRVVESLLAHLQPEAESPEAQELAALRLQVEALPAGALAPEALRDLHASPALHAPELRVLDRDLIGPR